MFTCGPVSNEINHFHPTSLCTDSCLGAHPRSARGGLRRRTRRGRSQRHRPSPGAAPAPHAAGLRYGAGPDGAGRLRTPLPQLGPPHSLAEGRGERFCSFRAFSSPCQSPRVDGWLSSGPTMLQHIGLRFSRTSFCSLAMGRVCCVRVGCGVMP